MNAETPNGRPAGDLDPELLINVVFFYAAIALRALLGQRHVVDLIGSLLGQRPMGLPPVLLVALAAGTFGALFRSPFGERGRLALVGADGLVQKSFELGEAYLPFSDLSVFLANDREDLLAAGLGLPGRSCGLILCDSSHGSVNNIGPPAWPTQTKPQPKLLPRTNGRVERIRLREPTGRVSRPRH